MKNNITFLLLIAIAFLVTNCESQKQALRAEGYNQAKEAATTIILVRHAEKVLGPRNPDLTGEGQQRAKDLEYFLKEVNLDAVYSSNYFRTVQTAKPVAEAKGLEIIHYDAGNLEALVDNLFESHKGKTILVVGHSNTTPEVANLLTGTKDLAHFSELVYDNILMVTAYEKGKAKVIQLNYGNTSK
jgi:broad specificity phosphatase PhoE